MYNNIAEVNETSEVGNEVGDEDCNEIGNSIAHERYLPSPLRQFVTSVGGLFCVHTSW